MLVLIREKNELEREKKRKKKWRHLGVNNYKIWMWSKILNTLIIWSFWLHSFIIIIYFESSSLELY